MTPAAILAAALAGAAAAAWFPPRVAPARVRVVLAAPRPHLVADPSRASPQRRHAVLTPRTAAALAGVGVAVAVVRVVGRLEPAARRRERDRCVADLPILVDLVGAAVRVGAPVDVALSGAGRALGGPLGDRACRVAALVGLGGRDPRTWADLSDLPGGPGLARALGRALDDGVAAGDVLARQAEQLRGARRAMRLDRARRVGVQAAVPLGLCLLPAFVLVGVVPVILSGIAGLGW